jgi:hypothetical protein
MKADKSLATYRHKREGMVDDSAIFYNQGAYLIYLVSKK